MALSSEIKDSLAFLKDLQAKAKDKKGDLEKAAKQLESLAEAIKGLADGKPEKLNAALGQWEGVNRLLLAKASAEHELTRKASPDWNAIGDGIAGVAGVAVKIGIAVASI